MAKKKRHRKRTKGEKKASRKKDAKVSCGECGRIMRKDEAGFMKRIGGKVLYFCQQHCVRDHSQRQTIFHVAVGAVAVSVMLIIISLSIQWFDFTPRKEVKHDPRMDYIGDRDIIFKNVVPHDDGYHTEMEIEIILTNRGEGPTGELFIDVFAENSTSRIIDDTFNTSKMRYVENSTTGSTIPSLKSAKVNGVLVLRPGTHYIYFRIYEDGLRGFIEGKRFIQVIEDQVVLQPWQDKPGSRDKASSEGSRSMDNTPGFEAIGVLGAIMAVILVKRMKDSKPTKRRRG